MRRNRWLALGVVGLGLILAAQSHSQVQVQQPKFGPQGQPAQPRPGELGQDIDKSAADGLAKKLAATTKLDQKDVLKVLAALGPALTESMSAGQTVQIPGLGSFRLIRVPERRSLVDGQAVVIPTRNVVEFVSDGSVAQATNAQGVTTAGSIPNSQTYILPTAPFEPLPSRTPESRAPDTRAPSSRSPSSRIR